MKKLVEFDDNTHFEEHNCQYAIGWLRV